MDKQWSEMTPKERQQERFRKWLSFSAVKFASPQAEERARKTVQRLVDVYQLKEPDRVPVSFSPGFFATRYAGITAEEAMYDPEKLAMAMRKYVRDFDVDTAAAGGIPGRPLDIVDYKLYKWPGHGVTSNAGYQYVEAEYMKADEYDAFIDDPSDFWLRTYMPRVFGTLGPLRKLSALTDIIELPMTSPFLLMMGQPDVQAAVQSLLDAGKEAVKWAEALRPLSKEFSEAGYPRTSGGFAKAPFDTLGDTLRGTKGIINDMYRQPEKLLAALERIVPLEIKRGVALANASGVPVVTMPLHKGADGFMSAKQFEKFYWPSLRAVATGFINEGIVPSFFAEGTYNSRLDIITELPSASVVWFFDQSDMQRAKATVGQTSCIQGNVPTSLLCAGTPEEVTAYCKHLIETVGKGGGFILSPGAGSDEAKPENVHALLAAGKEYGVYRKS